MKKSVLLLYGGQEESDISILSSSYIIECLAEIKDLKIITCFFSVSGELFLSNSIDQKIFSESDKITFAEGSIQKGNLNIKIDYCIPCIHGAPGESGDIQPILEYYKIPYLGNNSETSKICFNKISTKLWIEKIGIPTTPYKIITPADTSESKALKYKELGKNVFIKASSQGSSIGCYPVDDEASFTSSVAEAMKFGPYTLVEKEVKAREIEVAVFEYQNEIFISHPGEILHQNSFYSFDAKYSSNSPATTTLSPSISKETKDLIHEYSSKIFKAINLKDLSRIDYFLLENGQLYLNEINTFPGLTKISLFPKLLETTNISFKKYLLDRINH